MTPRRLVIANRGEIACRILRAARARGWTAAVVAAPGDAGARAAREADAVLPVESYLDLPGIVRAARDWGGELVHPGYGFLSERADFAEAVAAAGMAFVGPDPAAMRALGGKESAKRIARACGVPVLEALFSDELAALPPARWADELEARGIRPPFLVKASAGGGGRGMRVVAAAAELPEAVRRAGQEAAAGFGDGTVFVERFLPAPRHVEIQVFGDGRGGGVFLGERECSLQRRHQKVLEEAPSPAVGPALRAAMGRAALALVRAVGYRGAGTVEFLLDGEGRFHFLEVNARLQVEHPVTELVYGVDLVQAQLDLAEGRWPQALGDPARFAVPRPRGVALEARILAEDPRRDFRPAPGPVRAYREPAGPGIRVDSGVGPGDRIQPQFDSMIAKLVVQGADRAEAVDRLSRALEAFLVLGCGTNLPLLQAVSRSADYRAGRESTDWLRDRLALLNAPLLPAPWLDFLGSPGFRRALAGALAGIRVPPGPAERFAAQSGPGLRIGSTWELAPFRLEPGPEPHGYRLSGPALRSLLAAGAGTDDPDRARHVLGPALAEARSRAADPDLALPFAACRVDGSTLALALGGETLVLEDPAARTASARAGAAEAGPLLAPMAGKVVEVRAAPGQAVTAGDLLFVLESMKMQFEVRAPGPGRVERVCVAPGQLLQGAEPLAMLAAPEG